VFNARIGDVSGRGKLGTDMREIWMMQPRFERRHPNGARTMVEQPRFRAAFDFLRLRADNGEAPAELAEWWEDFSLGSEDDREAMLDALREQQRPAAKRSRRKKPAAEGDGEGGDDAGDDGEDTQADEGVGDADDGFGDEGGFAAPKPARKRRRRRRKPAGAADAGSGSAGSGDGAGAGD
jgi:poly(A) polymerase